MKEHEGVRFLLFAQFTSAVEAEMVRELFQREGIAVVLSGTSDPLGVVSGAQPILLFVAEPDWERAESLYRAFFQKPLLEEDHAS